MYFYVYVCDLIMFCMTTFMFDFNFQTFACVYVLYVICSIKLYDDLNHVLDLNSIAGHTYAD